MSAQFSKFSVMHTNGDDEYGNLNRVRETLSSLYDELRSADREHGDVGVTHEETGWYISAHRDGRVVFEHLGGEGTARHMLPVTKERTLALWERLISGDVEGLTKEDWKPGYV